MAVGSLIYQRARREGRIVRLGPRPVDLVGREALLTTLHESFNPDPRVPQVQVLCGMGGVGKTSVAVEFAYRRAHDYDLVWQFNTEDPGSLAGQMGELAALLGVVDVFEPGDILVNVQAELAARHRPWLFVLDNVTEPGVVADLVPSAGPGHVVVTSQRTDWPRGRTFEVPVLDRDVAVDFLLSNAQDSDHVVAGELADALGLLPLALAQAAAFLHNTGRPMADYLRLLSTDRARMLARAVPGGRAKAVTGAWAAAVSHLEKACPEAVDLLRLLACYAPDAIPVRLLLKGESGTETASGPAVESADVSGPVFAAIERLAQSEFALDDALIALRVFSLISAPVDGSVSIHRLVQASTLDELSATEREAWRVAAARLLENALPDDPRLPETWPTFAALLSHAEVALEPWSDGLHTMARYLGATGNERAAQDATQRLAAAREGHHGPEHPATLKARMHLATFAGEGQAAQARDTLAEILGVQERILGPEHLDTMSTRHFLAYWTGDAGDPAAARDQCVELLAVRERPGSPGTPPRPAISTPRWNRFMNGC